MIDATLETVERQSSPHEGEHADLHSEEHLAERFMFLKDYDLLDIDHGHFWHKLSWHGVHVEFPSPQYHYEANPHERQIRDYLLSLPIDVLERSFQRLQQQSQDEIIHGDHHFRLVWDEEVQRHLHCYYHRSEEGKRKDREAYQRRLADHVSSYERDRQFPSKRLQQKLEWLREERAKALKTVEAWDRLIIQVEEQMAQDQLMHTGVRVLDTAEH
jgi:hypothetical protein